VSKGKNKPKEPDSNGKSLQQEGIKVKGLDLREALVGGFPFSGLKKSGGEAMQQTKKCCHKVRAGKGG